MNYSSEDPKWERTHHSYDGSFQCVFLVGEYLFKSQHVSMYKDWRKPLVMVSVACVELSKLHTTVQLFLEDTWNIHKKDHICSVA